MESKNTSTRTTQNVKDIDAEQKRSLERLLGRPLADDEQIYVMAFKPGVIPDEATRRNALKRMQSTFEKVDEHVRAHGITPEEIDEAIDEAMEHIRHRKS